MANFAEQPRQFNPYVQQIPIDIYSAVGLQKQTEYNTGVQKVNSYIESLSGLNVARDTDKKYLNDRISDLTSKVNKVAAADWSNDAMLGQVHALSSTIYNDQNIQHAVLSTHKYMKDEQDIADAKKNGKWAPENEWIIRKQMSQWFADPSPGAEYQTTGLKPYEDVNADILKAWKDIKPNSTLVQRPNGDFYAYETINNQVVGKDGRTLIESSVRELPPDEVATQINSLLNPSQKEQLAISGLYQLRSISDPAGLTKLIDDHFKKSEDYYDKLLSNEKLNLSLNAGNSAATSAISDRIAAIENKRKQVGDNKSDYKVTAGSNPDAVKSSIYFENWLNGISNMIGYSDTSTKIIDNPAYKAQLEEYKVWARLKEATIRASKTTSAKSAKSKKNGDDGEEWEAVTGTVLPLSEEQRKDVSLNDFKEKLVGIGEQSNQAIYQLLYRNFGETYINHLFKDLNGDGIQEEIYTLKPGMEKEANLVTATWWDKYRKNDPGLDIIIQQTLQDNDEKKLLTSKLATVIDDVENKADKHVQTMPEYASAKAAMAAYFKLPTVKIQGQDISPADIKNYLTLRRENTRSYPSLGTGSGGQVYIADLSDKELSGYNLTRDKFNSLHHVDEGHSNNPETAHFNSVVNAYQATIPVTKKVDENRNSFISGEVRKYQGIFNQIAITVPSAKAEEVRPIANFVQTLAANAKQTDMGGSTNWSHVRDMVGEKNAKQTAYSYVQDRDGNVRIRLSNVDVNHGSPEEIVVDSKTAQVNHFYNPDYLATSRSLLDLGEGIRTGSTFEESVPTNNGRTGHYNVRHEIENFNGRYKVKLYVTDKNATEQKPQSLQINTTLFSDWNQLSNFLQNDLTERFLSSMLQADESSTAPASATAPAFTTPFSGNSLIPKGDQSQQ